MEKTNYPGVYKEGHQKFLYIASLGFDKVTGKRIQKKSRKDKDGRPLTSAQHAQKELRRILREYDKTLSGYSNYNMTYKDFMNNLYIPDYKTKVRESTFYVRETTLTHMRDRFKNKPVRLITMNDVQQYKVWLLSDANYSQSYASLIFGMFRKSLDFAVQMGIVQENIAKKIDAIPKGESNIKYWTKHEFEKVIAQIYIDDYYQHLNFVMLWLYFMTGVRVNEGTALYWNDLDFEKKQLRVHHMLEYKNKDNWKRNNYTKTINGKRIISLDDDTITILKEWKKRQQKNANSNFIFSYNGDPMLKSTISRIIHRYAKLADVHPIQAKGLRHSHASYLINELNADVLIVSKRLGHSSPEITLKHYSHMYSGQDLRIAEQMSGNVKTTTSGKNSISFNGNQSVK